MASSRTSRRSAPSGVKRRALAAHCRELARHRLARRMVESAADVEETIFQRADQAPAVDEQKALLGAVSCVRSQITALAVAFQRELDAIYSERLADAGHAGSTTVGRAAAADAPATHTRFAIDGSESYALRVRLAALEWGRVDGSEALPERMNPFAAEAIAEALERAVGVVAAQPIMRRAIVSAFEPHLAQTLRSVYASLNEMLAARGIVPIIAPAASDRDASAARAPTAPVEHALLAPVAASAIDPIPVRVARAAERTAPAAPAPAAMAVTQAMQAQGWVIAAQAHVAADGTAAWREALARALDSPPAVRRSVARMLADPDRFGFREALATPAGDVLVQTLSAMQAAPVLGRSEGGILSTLEPSVRRRSAPLDVLSLEFVGLVFDHILADRSLPESVAAQIARLQIAVAKAALLDRGFFARRDHAARRFLDRIAASAEDPTIDTGPGAPLVEALREIVNRVVAEFDTDLGVFTEASEQLDATMRFLADAREEALVPLLESTEAPDAALAAARAEIERRLTPETPDFVRLFLTGWWQRLLTQTLRAKRPGDASWTTRLAIADALVWSVGPRRRADIGRLAGMLPGLMRSLAEGMASVDAPLAVRRAFFDELMRHHTRTIEGAKGPPAPAETDVRSVTSVTSVTSPAAGASIAKLPPRAPALPAPAGEPLPPEYFEQAVRNLARGSVVEFVDAGRAVRTKLAWISPKHTVYLFTAGPTEARQLAPSVLADALRRGHARIVDASGALMDRIVRAITWDSAPR